MHRSRRLLGLFLGLGALASLIALPGRTTAAPPRHIAATSSRDAGNTLTIMTNNLMAAGFTKASASSTNSVASYYRYYQALWNKRFPQLKIKEIQVQTMADETTKTILAVNAGNPPDLIGMDTEVGTLVARKALMNLDDFYRRDHLTSGYYLPAMLDYARVNGHYYGIPGASNPAIGDIIYVPQYVKAAGWGPNKIPRTWDELWTAVQKVTTRDSKGNLTRIGLTVDAPSDDEINLFCGAFATYDPKTTKFHANSPCIKDYFRYEKRLLDFYGGVAKYTKFFSGDPLVWSCSKKAYLPSGKEIFHIEAYWIGDQMDTCYPDQWAESWAPTPHGTLAEQRAVRTTAWEWGIPQGAKHAQLAFDFVKFTSGDYGYVAGPTTNGYTFANQGEQWAQTLIKTEGQIRASHHYAGNPIVDAAKITIKGAQLGRVLRVTDAAGPYYDQQLTRAWQSIEYGRASVDQALDQAQLLVDNKQRVLHAQAGT